MKMNKILPLLFLVPATAIWVIVGTGGIVGLLFGADSAISNVASGCFAVAGAFGFLSAYGALRHAVKEFATPRP